MEWSITHIPETDSTNRWLRDNAAAGCSGCSAQPAGGQPQQEFGSVVVADYQTAGRGCGTNVWESERGKNLLFSILVRPDNLPASRQFHISMAISVAICEAVGQLVGELSVKWPNDIYWRNAKLAGILIENRLQGGVIRDSIVGVGLNVNQRQFVSDAPNPVSLYQISQAETSRTQLLNDILESFGRLLHTDVHSRYMSMLYRRRGFHPYADADGAFMATIAGVEPDGHLLLDDDSGRCRRYAFKEVSFII